MNLIELKLCMMYVPKIKFSLVLEWCLSILILVSQWILSHLKDVLKFYEHPKKFIERRLLERPDNAKYS